MDLFICGSDKNGIKRLIYSAIIKKKIICKRTSKAERRFIHIDDTVDASVNILKPKFVNKES